MLAFLARRLLYAAATLVVLTAIVYVMFDVPHRLERVFFHFDFGVSCSYPGCPPIKVLWGRGWHADVYLLLGGLVLGVTTGLAAAAYCATHPRALATRALETLALILYSLPVYLFALGLLLLFEPTFGMLRHRSSSTRRTTRRRYRTRGTSSRRCSCRGSSSPRRSGRS